MDLRDYQQQSVADISALFADGHRPATLVLPCGTGKTIVAGALLERWPSFTRVAFLVPTVHLLSQTIDRLAAQLPRTRFLAVCSPARLAGDEVPSPLRDADDTGSSDLSEAEIAAAAGDPVTTDPDTIAAALRNHGPVLIVGTYASAPVIAAAVGQGAPLDLLICDEAHHTAGFTTKAWALPLHDTLFPARRRLFMTATTRNVAVPADLPEDASDAEWEVSSMDDTRTYGPQVAPLSFRAAIDRGYLSDYQIAVVAVSHSDAMAAVDAAHARGDSIDTQQAAAQLALLHHMRKHPRIRSIMVFHNSIEQSWQWARQMRRIADSQGERVRVDHVDGTSSPAHRTAALNALADPDRVSIVTNCRLFAEGIDVPALDAVMFAGPRSSGPDIVQIVGRAIRPHPAGPGHRALIILPVIERPTDNASIDIKVARTSHLAAWQVLTTLAEEDDYVNNALIQWRNTIDTDVEPAEQEHSRITIDTSMLDEVTADDFRLHLVRRTTSHYVLTAQKLQAFAAKHGHANPPVAYRTPDGYPLGERVRDTRTAFRQNRLPKRLQQLFLAVPGFSWTASTSAARRTPDQWIDLVEKAVADRGGIRTLHRFEQTTDPATGQRAKIGEWLHTKALRRGYLDDSQRRRLQGLVQLPPPTRHR